MRLTRVLSSLKTGFQFQAILAITCLLIFSQLLNSCSKSESNQPFYFKGDQLNQLLDTCEVICERTNGNQSLLYLDQQLEGKKINWEEQFWINNFKIKKLYYDLKNHDLVLFYCNKNIELLKDKPINNKTKKMYAEAYYALAQFNFSNHKYNEALSNYKSAFKYIEDSNDPIDRAKYHYRLGMLFYRQQSFEEATKEFLISQYIYLEISNNYDLIYKTQEIIDNIGLCYHHRNMYDSAFYYFKTTIDFIEKNRVKYESHNVSWDIANAVVYENFGTTHEKLNNHKISYNYFKNAKSIFKINNYDPEILLDLNLKILNLLISQYPTNSNEIKQLFNEINSFQNKELNDVYTLEKFYKTKVNYYSFSKNFDSALYFFNLYDRTKELNKNLLFDAENNNLKEQLNDIKHQNQINELEQKLKLYVAPLFLFSLLIIILTIFLISKNRFAKKLTENANQIKTFNRQLLEEKSFQTQLIKKLETNQREKDILLRGVVHDLITPISSVIINMEFFEMKNKKLLNDTCFFKETLFTLNEMVSTCQDLLEFVTTKKLTLKFAENCLIEVVQSSINDLEGKLLKKNQHVFLHYQNDEKIVFSFDKNKIKRVLVNLLTNAIKFSNFNAKIQIFVEKVDKYVVVRIKDEGIGMSKEVIENNYGKPIMPGQTGTDGEQSFGLGLFISKQIVEAHNGKLIIESEIGKGTTISVCLPLK